MLLLDERWVRSYPHVRRAFTASEAAMLAARYVLRPWIARILGPCEVYGLERKFVRSYHDYRHCSRSGRGMVHTFFLRDGLYEVFEIVSIKHPQRYFIRCKDGSAERVPKAQVIEWLQTENAA